jgi:hypothetical protein
MYKMGGHMGIGKSEQKVCLSVHRQVSILLCNTAKHANVTLITFGAIIIASAGNMGVFQQFKHHPVLYDLSMEQAIMFIRLAAQLKRDIQLPLPCNQSVSSVLNCSCLSSSKCRAVSKQGYRDTC